MIQHAILSFHFLNVVESQLNLTSSGNMIVNDLAGVPRKTRTSSAKKTPTEKVTSDAASSQATEGLDDVSACDFAVVSQSAESSLQSTPKRGRRQTGHTQEAPQSCSKTNGPPVKRPRGRPRKNKTEDTTTQTLKRSRLRFELERADAAEQGSVLSVDLYLLW